ncbi:MAG: hypothetical protein HYV26_08205 [Candidatus Hydrogenedentes bacterium]|nr:hypothetical protein [Candidatus Hydrogenedentota bacterium]
MLFLLEYDKPTGSLLTFQRYGDSDTDWKQANDDLFQLELDLFRKGIDHEVVLLEAENEAALLVTHQRYFQDAQQILDSYIRTQMPLAG